MYIPLGGPRETFRENHAGVGEKKSLFGFWAQGPLIAQRAGSQGPLLSLDFAPRSLDFAPRSLDFAPRSLDFAPKSLDLAPRSLDLPPGLQT